MVERRSHTRFGALIPCQIHVLSQAYPAKLLEVSLGGASLSSAHVPGRGDEIKISVQLPKQQKTVTLHGSVLRVTRYIADYRGDACRFSVRFVAGVTPDSMMLVKEVAGGIR